MNSNVDYNNIDPLNIKVAKNVMNPFTDVIPVNHSRRYPSLFYNNTCGEMKQCNYPYKSGIINNASIQPKAGIVKYPPPNEKNEEKKENFGWKPRGIPGYFVDSAGRITNIGDAGETGIQPKAVNILKAPTSPENNLFLHNAIGVKPLLTLEERINNKNGYAISSYPMPGSEERCFWNKEVGGSNCPDPQNNVKLWKDTWSVHADESNPKEFQRYMARRVNRTYGKVRPPGICDENFNINDVQKNINEEYKNACGVYKDEFDIKAQIIDSIYKAETGGANGLINEDAISAVGDRAIEQIPWWRRGIQNRWYDYDAEESVGGFEFGSMSRGYDMDSLNCRISRTMPAGSCNSADMRRNLSYKKNNSIADLSRAAATKKISDMRPE